MRMCVCYLDCNEAAPSSYLEIQIENLLCALQLFSSIGDYLLTLPRNIKHLNREHIKIC
jgi:hypothetical protein